MKYIFVTDGEYTLYEQESTYKKIKTLTLKEATKLLTGEEIVMDESKDWLLHSLVVNTLEAKRK